MSRQHLWCDIRGCPKADSGQLHDVSFVDLIFVPIPGGNKARLEERILKTGNLNSLEEEEQLYGASCYVAVMTMDAMGQLFKEARGIMVSAWVCWAPGPGF